MKTTDYKVGDTVMLSDGKKYTYMGEREIGGSRSYDYEPIEGNPPSFGMMRGGNGNMFAPFTGMIEAEVVTRAEADPKPIRSRSEADPERKGLMRRALDWGERVEPLEALSICDPVRRGSRLGIHRRASGRDGVQR